MKLLITVLASCLFLSTFAHAGGTPIPKPLVVDDITAVVLHEARGEPIAGMVAVASVVLNRVNDPRWPDTEAEVIYEPHQFTGMLPAKRAARWRPADVERARVAVALARSDWIVVCGGGLLWYHATYIETPELWPDWISESCSIGGHVFFHDIRSGGMR